MPKYRFVGAKWRIGPHELQHGEVIELPAPPNRMFQLITEEPLKARAPVKATPKKKTAAPVTSKED